MRHPKALRLLAGTAAVLAASVTAACGSGGGSASTSAASTSGAHASLPGKGAPPITMGDKNFTEEYVLGQLYKQALEAKGFTVTLKGNIGSSEVIDQALTAGKIDWYPEYTGEIVLTLARETKAHPATPEQTYRLAQKFEESRGFKLLAMTPFFDRNELAVKPAFATRYHLKTIGDLAHVGNHASKVIYGADPEDKNRYAGLAGLKSVYGLTNINFKPLSPGLQYVALKNGNINVANVFSTDGELLNLNWVILDDTKHIMGFQNVAPVVSKKLLAKEPPAFAQTLNAVSAKLTNHVMQQLNYAAAVDKVSPAEVASKFLKANGLA